MFKVIEYRNVSGKIRMTIETEDSEAALFLHLFDKVAEFAHTYRYKIDSETKLDLSQKNRPTKLEQISRFRREQLSRFRELKGTRIERFRMLKNLRASQGEDVTLDSVMAGIQLAIEEERNDKLNMISQLIGKGYSPSMISIELKIPKSTVSRYLKKVSTNKINVDSDVPSMIIPFKKVRT